MNMRIQAYTFLCKRLSLNFRGTLFNPESSAILSLKRGFSQWHLVSAVCLERKPVITQPLTPLEQKYFTYLQDLEAEKSFLSDHEKRQIEDQ
ncbi:39S ribosomal protein L46, mitochondrial-like [Stegodyphus dumicola]|uniref:39S ribosomal protein L46, mitochondrial-like n=1 Tax=Stegodyphus dumicola TaxID=202533 RepID=UPI0015AC0BD0|nr:39S ribosomal protein L46, mitochondrial-like [Stegodyphus dumicola]